MDILIKGMEMKDYPQSITINPDGSVIKDTFGLHRPMDEWKAVALPEHHGRLGDLDELSDKLTGKGITRLLLSKKSYITVGDVKTIIDNAPTIVEASK